MQIEAKEFLVRLGIFPFDILVSINQEDEEVVSILEGLGVTNEADVQLAMSESRYKRGFYCMFSNKASLIRLHLTPENMHGTIAHECFHAVDCILRSIGVRLSEDSDEVYAYALEYVIGQVYASLSFCPVDLPISSDVP